MKNSCLFNKRANIYSSIFAIVLVALAVLFRTSWHLGPNIEFVTTASFLAATYLGGFWSAVVPLMAMVVSDRFIGNTNIFIFTWSGFVFIGLMDYWVIRKLGKRKLIFKQIGMGILVSFFFFFYTNFGVWWLDSFGMYPKTLVGLIECYFMGLPFLRFNLAGNLVFIPLTFTLSEFLYARLELCQKFFLTLKHLSRLWVR